MQLPQQEEIKIEKMFLHSNRCCGFHENTKVMCSCCIIIIVEP